MTSQTEVAARRRSTVAPRRPTEIDAIRLARKYRFQVSEIRDRLREFNCLDTDSTGVLTRAQFLGAVRDRLSMKEDAQISEDVLREIWRTTDADGSGTIDFEEFIVWTQTIAFSEQMVLPDPADRRIRELAKRHQVPIPEVEHIWKEFLKFDSDASGVIERSEFRQLIRVLLKAKDDFEIPKERLDRLWKEADANADGVVNFTEFLLWYRRFFVPDSRETLDSAIGDPCPAATVYRKLGADRLANWQSTAEGDGSGRRGGASARVHATTKA